MIFAVLVIKREAIMALEAFSIDDLYYVMDSMHNAEIRAKFDGSQVKELYNNVPIPKLPKINITSRAIFSAITEGPSCSLVILWSIIGLVSLSLISLSILTAVFICLLISTGAIFFYSTMRESKRENHKASKEINLLELKLICANEIFRRQKYQMAKEKIPQAALSEKVFSLNLEKPIKNKFPHLKKSIGATLMVTPMLFGTYYFVTTGILAAFGLTTISGILTGPIGIGIAIAAALCIGIFFGYKLYQSCIHEELFNKKIKRINKIVDYKRRICYEQKHKLSHKKSVSHELIQPDIVHNNHTCNIKYARLPMVLVNRQAITRKPISEVIETCKKSHYSSF